MNTISSALSGLAGVTLGFALWLHVRRHECQYETVLKNELDADDIPSVTDVKLAEWSLGICKCGSTAEFIGVMHSDSSIEIFPCVGVGSIDE